MELDDLKSAWNKFSEESDKKQVSQEHFGKLIHKKAKDITERIGRNIRIGLLIIIVWIIFGFTSDYFISPVLEQLNNVPDLSEEFKFWAYVIQASMYVLILGVMILFWIRYNKIEKTKAIELDLRGNLMRIINIVDSYKRMFYVVLVVVLIYASISILIGFFMGGNYQIQELGLDISAVSFFRWILLIVTLSIVIGIVIGVYYFLFNLFFKRLYGRYLVQLKAALKELEEASSIA